MLGSSLYYAQFLGSALEVKFKFQNLTFFPLLYDQSQFKSFIFVFNFMILMSDAHDPVVDRKPGQIMAQFFAAIGELTVLVS